MPFELAMVDGGGILQLRGGEPFEIPSPTSVSGSVDDVTGAISGGAFSTPTVSIEQNITSPVVATVYIDAVFSQVAAGNLTGLVDPDGNVLVQVALSVSLDISVSRNPTILTAQCVTSPVVLGLSSVDPQNEETGLVTLVDEDFAVPPAAAGPGCPEIVADAVNEQLAGGGHSLSLTLTGQVPRPPQPGDPTETTLMVVPAGGARVGDAVTLSAMVAPGPDAESSDVPAGQIDFLDGGRVIETVTLDENGEASIVTSTLPAGSHKLAARYRGGDGVFNGSISEVVTYAVLANPALTWNLPHLVQIAGDAADFDVTVRNTGFGGDVTNARFDVTIKRVVGTGPIGPVSGLPRILLSRLDGEDGAVALTTAGSGGNQTLSGSLGPVTGFALNAGDTLVERLRLELPANGTVSPTACGATNRLCPGPFTITFELVIVDPDDGTELSTLLTDTGKFTATEATRRSTTVGAGQAAVPSPIPGNPPLVPAIPPVTPHTVRQGNNIMLHPLRVNPPVTGLLPSGFVEFQIDGKSVPARRTDADTRLGYRSRLEIVTTAGTNFNTPVSIPIPLDTAPGTRTLTVRYLGDALFLPSVASFTFDVIPSTGSAFECTQPGLLSSNILVGANVVLQASMPVVVAAGAVVDLQHIDMAVFLDRGPSSHGAWSDFPSLHTMFESASIELSPGGSTEVSGVSFSNTTRMDVAGNPDQILTFDDLALSVQVDGAPGEVVPVALDSIEITHGTSFGFFPTLSCVPVGGPVVIAELVVAKTVLEVSPASRVRVGSPVILTALSAPVGSGAVVEFMSGTNTIGVVPVVAGQATLVIDGLPEGDHVLSARSWPGLGVPSTASTPVDLEILQAHECAAFAEAGNAAVVRLVYMELLRRCPDQVGFDYWVDRLDGGTSSEAFARSIARTPEAVGVVVNDGYQTMLGRNADAAGRTFWVGQLQAHGRYDRLLADLAASDEFWTKAGSTNEGFVTRVYDRLLHRAPDQGGLDFWVGRLDAGASRRALVLTLANLDEPLGVLVVQSYDEILSRNPFTGERVTGITFLRDTGDRSGLYAQLIGRPEFDSRAQGFPNPED